VYVNFTYIGVNRDHTLFTAEIAAMIENGTL
jgi:hypothetical protein